MTPEEVVKLADFNARELRLSWHITKSRDIRLNRLGIDYCPLEVAGNFEAWFNSAQDLMLSEQDTQTVMNAADDVQSNYIEAGLTSRLDASKELRAVMMKRFEFEVPHA